MKRCLHSPHVRTKVLARSLRNAPLAVDLLILLESLQLLLSHLFSALLHQYTLTVSALPLLLES